MEVMNKSLNYARDNYDEKLVKAIQPGYHPMESELIFGEEDGQSDEISRDSYLHMFIWTRYRDGDERKLRLVEMSGCGVILRDSKEESGDGFYPDNRYPYFFTPDMYREGTVWGKSTAELLINTQDIIDDLDDQIRLNARLTGNPQRLVHTNSGIDPDKITNEGGITIPPDEMDGYKFVQPPEMPAYVINRRNQALQFERVVISRFSDQMNGVKQTGVDTATEALGLQQGGTQSITHSKGLLEETLADIFEYCLELVMEYWTEEEWFALTEKPDHYEYFRPSDLKQIPMLIPASEGFKNQFSQDFPNAESVPQYMPYKKGGKEVTKKIALDISVNVGAGLPSNKAFVYSVIKEARASGDITPQESRTLLKEYVGLPIDDEPPMDQNQISQIIQQEVQKALQGAQMAQVGGGMPMQQPMQSPMVQGLTSGNNPALSVVQGGGM